ASACCDIGSPGESGSLECVRGESINKKYSHSQLGTGRAPPGRSGLPTACVYSSAHDRRGGVPASTESRQGGVAAMKTETESPSAGSTQQHEPERAVFERQQTFAPSLRATTARERIDKLERLGAALRARQR